jgi:broad specificity phosphatase PhoE
MLQSRPSVSVFVDDRLIERCYGVLQGKNKKKMEHENPYLYAQIHQGYDFAPPEGEPEGECLEMIEKRVTSFLE